MKTKTFDCIQMKNRIQQELLERQKSDGPRHMRAERTRWLAEGQDDLSRLWQQIPIRRVRPSDANAHLIVREEES